MYSNDQRIKQLKAELQKLENEKRIYETLPEEKQLAEALHSHLCKSDHVEYCDWFYGSWDKPSHAHKEYLNKAIELLKVQNAETIMKIVNLL